MVHRRYGVARLTVLTLAVGVPGIACSGDNGDDPGATAVTTTTTIAPPAATDGRLTIGVMLPPASSLLRESLTAGVEEAIDQVNAAGGSFGGPVRLVPVDEGDTVASARDAIEELLSEDVDAIVGPASSVIALGTLETITSNEVLACSPTATSLALDSFPNRQLFFRTVPSDSMQAMAIARVAEGTGEQSAAIVYVDDAYGRPFSDAVAAELASVSIDVAGTVGFPSGVDELDEQVDAALDLGAGVVIVLANSNDGTQFLESMSESSSVPFPFPKVIVNDAMRSSESAQRLASLPPSVRERITGVAPQAESSNPDEPFDPPGPFATNAFDCVTLIALAANFAQSDKAADIAGSMASVSSGGSVCFNYAACAEDLEDDLLIDYNGPSGVTEISATTGDTTRGRFDVFFIDADGSDVWNRSLPIDA